MTAEAPEGRCGHPTKRGGLCKNHPLAGAERCHHHVGLEPTEAQRRASRENPIEHGYFVSGFLDDEERELFEGVLDGDLDASAIRLQAIGALVVRAARMTRWEAEGQQVSGFTTDVFTELRKTLESVDPDELRVEHTWDDAEIAEQVQRVLDQDHDLLLSLVPEDAREAVREALEAREG